MRKFLVYATAAVVAVATSAGAAGAAGASKTGGSAGSLAGQTSSSAAQQAATEYVVLYSQGANGAAARAAIAAAGGDLVSQNAKLGYAVARSSSASFATNVDKSPAGIGAARNRVIGAAPQARRARSGDVERLTSERRAAGRTPAAAAKVAPAPPTIPLAEPLANRQWDMRQIRATPAGSYARQPGKAGVPVGVIDIGIDGTHPDIAANFDAARSRNFVTHIPSIDGPCEVPSCIDPANVDDDGHGTHVASTIASPINGLGLPEWRPR